jgi:hypothetical protein
MYNKILDQTSMGASICWAAAEAFTQLAIFAYYALKKQWLI